MVIRPARLRDAVVVGCRSHSAPRLRSMQRQTTTPTDTLSGATRCGVVAPWHRVRGR